MRNRRMYDALALQALTISLTENNRRQSIRYACELFSYKTCLPKISQINVCLVAFVHIAFYATTMLSACLLRKKDFKSMTDRTN
jgi:hypothetical protein